MKFFFPLVALAALVLLTIAADAGHAQNPPPAPPPQNRDLVRADAAFSAVQKRVALVIGNKDYADAPLKNPVNDAQAMAAALKDLGFDVLCKTNLTNRQMVAAVSEFAQKLGPNTIGLFYFSGHGVQVDGINYLVPIGYNIERQADVPFEAFPAQRLLSTMGGAGCPLNIVILDACRNNPLPKSIKALSGDKGLGKMDAPSGTFIAYATAPGQTASDDSEKENGLYTGVLLQKMKTPGLKIEEVFKATRISVIAASGGAQTPWDESSITNDFYFAAGLPGIVSAPAPVPPPVPVAPVVVSGEAVDLTARLVISGLPPGARVEVDGHALTGTEYSVDLPRETSKEVMVLVEASGYRPLSRKVVLKRGVPLSLPLTLRAAVAAPAPVAVPAAPVSPPPVAKNVNPSVNPKDGAELVLIPAGPFIMGDDDVRDYESIANNPRRTVTLPVYSIYKNLVTVAMYEKFCRETNRKMPAPPNFNPKWSKKDHPIVNVSWNDAEAYCGWAGASLPSEAQWEKAARGGDGRAFPWGNTFDASKLCSSVKKKATGTSSVGSFPSGASPYGVLDMAGNVWQWCDDWYDAHKDSKAVRSGDWDNDAADYLRCANRYKSVPDIRDGYDGFRCVLLPAGR